MIPVLTPILEIIKRFVPDPEDANKAAIALESEMTKQMQMKSSIIQAEMANGSGKWRVHLMYLCMTIVAAHAVMYDLVPYIRTVFDLNFYIPQTFIFFKMRVLLLSYFRNTLRITSSNRRFIFVNIQFSTIIIFKILRYKPINSFNNV